MPEMNDWERSVEFHGHSCLGLAMGFQAVRAARSVLGEARDVDEELLAVVENDSCAVDAVQVLTGCTFGKGNLIFQNHGKHAYTFARRPHGPAVRVTVNPWADPRRSELGQLRENQLRGTPTAADQQRQAELMAGMVKDFLSQSPTEVVTARTIDFELPERARIFPAVECGYCHEQVMEPRARLHRGKPACLPCAHRLAHS